MEIEDESGDAFAHDGAEAERGRERHGGERVRGLQFTEDHPVAHGGPANLAVQLHLQMVFGEEAQLVRHDERRAIGERHEAESELARSGDTAVGEGRHHVRFFHSVGLLPEALAVEMPSPGFQRQRERNVLIGAMNPIHSRRQSCKKRVKMRLATDPQNGVFTAN